jgi:cellobiose-specific phosphotransferase system component IIB
MKLFFRKLSLEMLIGFISVCVIGGISFVLLIQNIDTAREHGVFEGKHRNPITDILTKNKERNTISERDVALIEPWMTFAYVNFIFSIPEENFRAQFHITDTRYPNMPIGMYIKDAKSDSKEVLELIRTEARNALLSTTKKPQ